jgi:glycosyltransferase involved in cell wall biosynthesis
MSLKICRVTTVPYAYVHFKDVLKSIHSEGHDIALVSSDGDYWNVLEVELGIQKSMVNIEREINPLRDILSIISLFRFFKKNSFDIVHSSTPKAGLLTSIAAFFARVPVRIHTFTGQRWETLTGFKRALLIFLDKLVVALNTWCYTDSPSQTSYLQEMGILKKSKSSCLGHGSFGGIDPEKYSKRQSAISRSDLNIPDDAYVLSFVGRLNRDKGIVELLNAFGKVQKEIPDIYLLMIGPIEEESGVLPFECIEKIKNDKFIIHVGFQKNPEDYLRLSDVMILPSYREGFGTVVLEAAILGIPTIGSNIIGLRDAIIDGQTGLLCNVHDADSLAEKIRELFLNSDYRMRLGLRAKERVIADFHFEVLAKLLLNDYLKFSGQSSD